MTLFEIIRAARQHLQENGRARQPWESRPQLDSVKQVVTMYTVR